MLRCSGCKLEKDVEVFGKNKSRKTGHNCYCKECANKINYKWREDNSEKWTEHKRKDYLKHREKRIATDKKHKQETHYHARYDYKRTRKDLQRNPEIQRCS